MATVARLEETVRAYRAVTEADGFDVVDRLERLILDHEPGARRKRRRCWRWSARTWRPAGEAMVATSGR
jgi:hypothetical protein